MKKILLVGVVVLITFACSQEGSSNWKETDLLDKGLPITILAPDSINVKIDESLGFMQDVTIDSEEDNYHLQIYAANATSSDVALLKSDQIQDVRGNPFFTKIIKEDEKGFVYETMIDSTNYYSFRYVHVQGDQEFVFQTGLAHTFSQEEAEKLYEAVRQEKE